MFKVRYDKRPNSSQRGQCFQEKKSAVASTVQADDNVYVITHKKIKIKKKTGKSY